MKWNFLVRLLFISFFSISSLAHASQVRVISGLDAARDYQGKSSNIYIRAGSFSNKHNAKRYQSFLRANTDSAVKMSYKHRYYMVTIGPMHSATETRKLASQIPAEFKEAAIQQNKFLKSTPQQAVSNPPPVLAENTTSSTWPLNPVAPNQVLNTEPAPKIIPTKTETAVKPATQNTPLKPITHVNDVNKVKPVENSPPANKLATPVSMKPVVMTTTPPVYEDQIDNHFSHANWIVSVNGGEQFPMLNSSMTVNNGSGFPAPFNQDLYNTKQNNQPILAISAGRRWTRDNSWFPSFTVSLSYRYLFAANAGSNMLQYSDPTFNNYTYRWDASANLLLTQFKLNVYEYAKFSPFITAALGGGLVTSDNYSESPLKGIDPRVSPGFGGNHSWQLAYGIGAGLDYHIARQFILSAEYQFLDLGSVSSGSGAGSWSGQSLNLGSYRTNIAMLSIGYLFSI